MKKKLACSGLAVAAVIAFAVFVGFGCGTIANMNGTLFPLMDLPGQVPPRPFGGVGQDLKWIATGNIFFIADIPFSLAGDVVTLPKVLLKSADPLQESIRHGERKASKDGWTKLDPVPVLKEVPLDSTIEEAQAVMEKHGFSCSTKPGDESSKNGSTLRATVYKRTSLLTGNHIAVTFHCREGKIADVEVDYDGP